MTVILIYAFFARQESVNNVFLMLTNLLGIVSFVILTNTLMYSEETVFLVQTTVLPAHTSESVLNANTIIFWSQD